MIFGNRSVQIDSVEIVLEVAVEIASDSERLADVQVGESEVICQSERVVKMQNDLVSILVDDSKGDLNISIKVVSVLYFGAVEFQSSGHLGKVVIVRLEVGSDDQVVVYWLVILW